MNLNVWAVERVDDDGERVVVDSYLTAPDAHELAEEYRELGYDDVRVRSWA